MGHHKRGFLMQPVRHLCRRQTVSARILLAIFVALLSLDTIAWGGESKGKGARSAAIVGGGTVLGGLIGWGVASPSKTAGTAKTVQGADAALNIEESGKENTKGNFPYGAMLAGAAIGGTVGMLGNTMVESYLDGKDEKSSLNGDDFTSSLDPASRETFGSAVDELRRAEEGLGGRDKLVDVLNNPDQYLTDEDKAELASMADSALGGSGISPDAYYGDTSQIGSGEDPYSLVGRQKQEDVSHKLSYLTDSMNGQFPAGGIPGVYAYNQGGRSGSGSLFGSGGSGFDANGLLSSFFPNKNGGGGSPGSGGMRSLAAAEGHGQGGAGNGAYSLPDGAPVLFQAVHYYTPRFVQYNQLKQAQAKREDEARAKRLLSAASPGNGAAARNVSGQETMIVSQPLSHQAAIGITAGAPLGVGIKVAPFPPDVN
ncbi:MAG: hypothetical protein HY391_05580, partial [Deltaproteobacteria bacterium]|nr:hypothetical protein [Deltaproteobacteria bacterium]